MIEYPYELLREKDVRIAELEELLTWYANASDYELADDGGQRARLLLRASRAQAGRSPG